MGSPFANCPWGQCDHGPNTHGRDHCLACHCVKPPPPPPGAPQQTPEVELEALTAETCGVCSALVDDRDKHVRYHERQTDAIANLVMSLGALERRLNRHEDTGAC